MTDDMFGLAHPEPKWVAWSQAPNGQWEAIASADSSEELEHLYPETLVLKFRERPYAEDHAPTNRYEKHRGH